ncbi:histidine kinase, partial [Streptomyces varsoviensis]
MRRRLINSTLAVVLVVIAVFGISLVIVETRTIESSAQESVQSEAVRLVSIVDSRLLGGERVASGVLREQITPNRYAKIEIPGRAAIEVGEHPAGEVITATQKGERGETITVVESRTTVSQEIGRTLMVILGVALLAVVAAVFLAVR